MKSNLTKNFRKLALLIFKIIGLAPFTYRDSKNPNDSLKDTWKSCNNSKFVYSQIGNIYNCALIVLQIYLCYTAYRLASDFSYPDKSTITTTIEMCLTISGNSMLVIIWGSYTVKQKTLVNLANRLTSIDATLDRLNGGNLALLRNKSILKYSLILIVINAIGWIQTLISEDMAFNAPLMTWFSFVIPSVIATLFILQYVLILKFIENRFRFLNNILLNCSINSITFPLRSFLIERDSIDDLGVTKIVSLRRAHTFLYEISCGFDDFYSLPILSTVGFMFLVILYNAYYLLVPLVIASENHTDWMVGDCICWILQLIVPIGMLNRGVNGVVAQMKKTSDVIPQLLARRSNDRQDKFELEMFCYELLNKNVEFTAYKFFSLDGVLQSVIGMVATYLTIMFQLQTNASGIPSAEKNYTNDKKVF